MIITLFHNYYNFSLRVQPQLGRLKTIFGCRSPPEQLISKQIIL